MEPIEFDAIPIQINDWIIIQLPKANSALLPSRGMVMVEGTINNIPFNAPLEPDGKFSHWFKVDEPLRSNAQIEIGKTVSLSLLPMVSWLLPDLPDTIRSGIAQSGLTDQWKTLTPKAQWEWIRWIRSTKSLQTRQKRIEVMCSKLEAGMRRPCCFDQTRCTITEVSDNGILRGY